MEAFPWWRRAMRAYLAMYSPNREPDYWCRACGYAWSMD